MSDLRDLYQQLILDHARSPRNFGETAGAARAEGYNPLCGDHFTVWVAVEDGKIRAASFQGQGCAISTASASVMTDAVRGRSPAEAAELFERFHDVVTGGEGAAESLGKLVVFAGVRDYPARVKCATLAWHALRAALDQDRSIVSTEHEP